MLYNRERLKKLNMCEEDINYILSNKIVNRTNEIINTIHRRLEFYDLLYVGELDEFLISLESIVLREVFKLTEVTIGEDIFDKYLDIKVVKIDEFIKDINCVYQYSKENDMERLMYNFFRIIGNENEHSELEYNLSSINDDLYVLSNDYSLDMSILRKYISNDYENNKNKILYNFGKYNKKNNDLLLALYEESDVLFKEGKIYEDNLKFTLYIVR